MWTKVCLLLISNCLTQLEAIPFQDEESNQGAIPTWTWLAGDTTVDSLSTHEHPGGLSGAAVWYDSFADMTWIFGGRGFSQIPSGTPQLLDDLWQFKANNINTLSKIRSAAPFKFRKILVQRNTQNSSHQLVPPGRQFASLCGIQQRLVLFGGLTADQSPLADLWVFDTKSDSWSKKRSYGPAARAHAAVWCFGPSMYIFGGLGQNGMIYSDMWKLNLYSLNWIQLQGSREEWSSPNQSIVPEGRNGASTWISDSALYIFGGNTASSFSYSVPLSKGLVSDMWRFFPCNFTWELVNGPTSKQQAGFHTAGHVYSQTNLPGSRLGAGSWTDSYGGLWLFGGAGVDGHPQIFSQVLSDIWHFRPQSLTWAFIGGSDVGGTPGKYGGVQESSGEVHPGARTEMMVLRGRTDGSQVFMLGGRGRDARHVDGYLNDLWSVNVYNVLSGDYAISGSSLLIFLGVGCGLLLVALVTGLWGRSQKNSRVLRPGYEYKIFVPNTDKQLSPLLINPAS